MTTIEARHATSTKRTKPATTAKGAKPKAVGKPSSAQAGPSKADPSNEIHAARVTKHDRVLTLLSQRSGTTIPEIMEATGWQQHSVRGFLAGTVKKKLGFTLTSSRSEGELRRYRIVDRGFVEADHRSERTADEMELVLDNEIGGSQPRDVANGGARQSLVCLVRAGAVGFGPEKPVARHSVVAMPKSVRTSPFHAMSANLSTVAIIIDGGRW